MTDRRDHTPAKSIGEIVALGGAFSVDTARAVVDAVGLPIMATASYQAEGEPEADLPFCQLAERLNTATGNWAWNERQQTSASPKMQAALAQSVAGKCGALLATLLDENGELKESLRGGGLWAQAAIEGADSGREAVQDAIGAIASLATWSGAMAARAGLQAGNGAPATRQGDKALQSFIADLGGVFWELWRRVPTVSRVKDTGKPSGPFFRFVAAVNLHLGLGKSDEAIATAISRNPTLAAMRRVWAA